MYSRNFTSEKKKEFLLNHIPNQSFKLRHNTNERVSNSTTYGSALV
jgi:hypothetical protein